MMNWNYIRRTTNPTQQYFFDEDTNVYDDNVDENGQTEVTLLRSKNNKNSKKRKKHYTKHVGDNNGMSSSTSTFVKDKKSSMMMMMEEEDQDFDNDGNSNNIIDSTTTTPTNKSSTTETQNDYGQNYDTYASNFKRKRIKVKSRRADNPNDTLPQLRLNWSETEHEKFLFAIKLYENDKKKWKKVAAYIGTRTAHQCRGHFSAYSGNRYKTKMLKRDTIIDGGGGGEE